MTQNSNKQGFLLALNSISENLTRIAIALETHVGYDADTIKTMSEIDKVLAPTEGSEHLNINIDEVRNVLLKLESARRKEIVNRQGPCLSDLNQQQLKTVYEEACECLN